MSTQFPQIDSSPPDDDIVAAEYVLGVLDAPAHLEAQARAATDAAFAQAVAAWESRLAPLVMAVEPVPTPEHVWPRLRSRLGWSAVEGGRPRSDGASAPTRRAWPLVAGLAAAAALAVVFVTRTPPQAPRPEAPVATVPVPTTPEPRTDVMLADEKGVPRFAATLEPRTGRMRVRPVAVGPLPAGRVPELWVIPAGGAPKSLGLIAADGEREMTVPAELRSVLVAGATLAVSVERPEGAPHAAPEGPVIATGTIGNT